MQVTEQNSIEATFKDVVKTYSKPPIIIVNSAGILLANDLISFSSKDFDELINVNLKGTFLVMQTAVKEMIEANATKNSSIINISSLAAKHSFPRLSIYNVTKAGVVSLTKVACKEFGKYVFEINKLI